MIHSRRTFLLAAGGGLALAATGGVWRVLRVPESAATPWSLAPQGPADVRLDAFRHAILAPNPHNRQPWRIRLVGADEAIVSCDLARRLPHTDPFDRQIVIGFGSFLELARMAAAARGVRMETILFPEGEPRPRLDGRPIARLRFIPDASAKADPLFAAVGRRRSVKEPFDMARPVAAGDLAALAAHAAPGLSLAGSAEPALAADLRALITRAFHVESATPRTLKESVDLLRVGSAEIERNPDGIALKGPLFEALSLMGADSVRASAMDPSSGAYRSTMARYEKMFAATPAFVWMTGAGETRADEIAAGGLWLRAHLDAAARGLALHPVSQALQEFPEMRAEYDRVHAMLAVRPGARLHMLGRLGYGPAVGPSARWPLAAKLETA